MTNLAEKPILSGQPADVLPRPDPMSHLPIVVLFPHSRCNCRCRMCDIWRATGRTEIGVEEVERWAEEWQPLGVERVALSGGEALMHPKIEEMCALLHCRGFGITLMTTGLLLERHAGWLPMYVDDIIVSLDGPEDVHNSIRNVPRAFEKMRAGVGALRRCVPVSGRCVVQKANYEYLLETIATAKEIGLVRISFLAADVTSEAFNRPGGWNEERAGQVALSATDLPKLERQIERLELECAGEFARGFITESAEKLRARLLQYFRAVCGQADFPPVRCNAPWVSCVVEADGAVKPCFFQPAYGNLRDASSLEELLNGERAVVFRRHLDVGTDPICRRCVCTLALEEK